MLPPPPHHNGVLCRLAEVPGDVLASGVTARVFPYIISQWYDYGRTRIFIIILQLGSTSPYVPDVDGNQTCHPNLVRIVPWRVSPRCLTYLIGWVSILALTSSPDTAMSSGTATLDLVNDYSQIAANFVTLGKPLVLLGKITTSHSPLGALVEGDQAMKKIIKLLDRTKSSMDKKTHDRIQNDWDQ